MDISAKAINYFLKCIGRERQLSLALRRFRGRYVGGNEEEYYIDIVIPHKIAVYERGLGLAKLAKSYHEFKDRRLIDHDMSKLSKPEQAYAKMDFDNFDNNSSRQLKKFRDAWHHHKHHNPHHPEYWFSVNKSGLVDVLPMPYDYILEMVADWMGAESYGQTMEDFLAENLSGFVFHKDTARQLQIILDGFGIKTKSAKSNKFFNAKILR